MSCDNAAGQQPRDGQDMEPQGASLCPGLGPLPWPSVATFWSVLRRWNWTEVALEEVVYLPGGTGNLADACHLNSASRHALSVGEHFDRCWTVRCANADNQS
jgi:hypothetical protein